MRDPRVEPRKGDVIEMLSGRYVVKYVDHGRVYDEDVRDESNVGINSMRSWREWAKDATVIHRAEEEGND